jgi:hypothetical protein
MALLPSRPRGTLEKAAQTARNLAIADAALAFAKDRMGRPSRSRRPSTRAILLGGAAIAVAAGVLYKRDKIAGMLPGRGETYEPHVPGPSNYDVSGPVENTATPVPAPDPQQPAAVDEAAEEAAAAAEAANIGGPVSDYAGPADQAATEAERPLAEAGEGEAEGQEQAERELQKAAEPTAPGKSAAERQIEETIEEAANPTAGERVEPLRPPEGLEAEGETPAAGTGEPASEEAAPEEAAPDRPAPAKRRSVKP